MVNVLPALDPDNVFAFTPVAPRLRRDGWTPAAQAAFIAALADGDSVTAACRRAGRSRKSAYALRQRVDAASFAAAWDAAVEHIDAVATGTAFARCLEGTLKPVVYRGRIIGERLVHNDRLLLHMLRRSAPQAALADPYVAFDKAQRALYNTNLGGPGEIFK